ncbi:MAG: DNA mismatch repair protein MutS, partial [Flavobacterium sp.]
MVSITPKTLQDLEFETVVQTVSGLCNTELGREKALQLKPILYSDALMQQLLQTSEYLASFSNNNALPNHGFDNLSNEIKFLGIEDSFLELASFRKIAQLSETANSQLVFLKKFQEYYPQLYLRSQSVELTKIIVQLIDA